MRQPTILQITMPKLIFLLLALQLTACAHGQSTRSAANNKQPGPVAASHALQLVGTHYRYGGTSPAQGFDCSGLVQYSYKKAGINVPRNTRLQRKSSRAVSYNHLKKGDLLFFHQAGKRYGHVAIYIGNQQFVHAPSSGKRVRVDSLTSRYWRRHLASARRFDLF